MLWQYLSKTDLKEAQALVVFQIPPPAVPMYMMRGSLFTASMQVVLPPITAGPMALARFMLMLPSANRENKQSLRVFRDSGGFTDFFPPEDRYAEHENLLAAIPNLDCFGDGEDLVFGKVEVYPDESSCSSNYAYCGKKKRPEPSPRLLEAFQRGDRTPREVPSDE